MARAWSPKALLLGCCALHRFCYHWIRWVSITALWLDIYRADGAFCRMMLNTSQNLDTWQVYFDEPSGATLGLMNAIYQIGSLASFPFV